MITPKITRVTLGDIDTLQKISVNTFIKTFAPHNTEEDMAAYVLSHLNHEKLLQEIQDPHSQFYIARVEDLTAGYLKVNSGPAQTELKDDKALEIERIYVDKKFQGRRIGEALLNTALEAARQLNCEFVWLGVWEKNINAIAFYQRFGFSEFDRHPFKLGNDVQTDLMMKLSLR